MRVRVILPVTIRKCISLLHVVKDVNVGLVRMYDALSYLLDNIYIKFGNKLYRQMAGTPMGTHCAPLVTDLFLYFYERDFIILFLVIIKPI